MIAVGARRWRRRFWRGRDRLQYRIGLGIHKEPLSTSLEWEIRRLISLNEIDLVLDVGANAGMFVNRLRRIVKYPGEVISFEPGPVADVAAEQAQFDHHWRVEHFGLGDNDQLEILHIAEGDDFSSLHRPLESSSILFPKVATKRSLEVPIRRLDSMWGELGAEGRSVLLKTDTQGHDMQVLEGCGRRLDEVSVVLLEASNVALYEEQQPLEVTIDIMRSRGLLLGGAFPVSRRRGVTVEFDCIFARATSG